MVLLRCGSSSRHTLFACTSNATLGHRIDRKPPIWNFAAAFLAIAIILTGQPALCHLNANKIAFAGSFRSLLHGLILQRVHTRQPPDRLLIEFHGSTRVFAEFGKLKQFGLFAHKPFAGQLLINCHLVSLPSGSIPTFASHLPHAYQQMLES